MTTSRQTPQLNTNFVCRQNKTEKKGKDSGISVSSTKRNSGSAEHQNRNDQGISSFRDHEASSSSLWAKLLVSSSKLSQLEISNASLRTADHPSATVLLAQLVHLFIRPPDIVCRRTYILPVFLSFFLLLSSFFSPPNLRGH